MMGDDDFQIDAEIVRGAPFVVPDISGEGVVPCTCGAIRFECSGGPEGSNVVATCPFCDCVIEARSPYPTATTED